jgi:hypothetical protein
MHDNIVFVIVHYLCYYCREMTSLATYLKEHFDLDINLIPIPQQELERLPLYLRGGFRFFKGNLLDNKVVWAEPLGENQFTPEQLHTHAQQIKQHLDSPIVFILDNIESWQRQRLIRRKVSFVQPSKQIYVPELLLELNNVRRLSQNQPKALSEKLSFPAQAIVLYHLGVGSIEEMSFQDIAQHVHYSSMSVTRAVKELNAFGLVLIKGTKGKSIAFKKQGKALWDQILPMLQSPVKDIWYVSEIIGDIEYMKAGESALSAYTMLAEPDQQTVALERDEFLDLKKREALKDINKRHGEIKIEVWNYNPHIFSTENKVDRLSLYVALKDEDDERIKSALADMIIQMKW